MIVPSNTHTHLSVYLYTEAWLHWFLKKDLEKEFKVHQNNKHYHIVTTLKEDFTTLKAFLSLQII